MKRRLIVGSLLLVCGALTIGAHYWLSGRTAKPAPGTAGVLKPGQTIGAPEAARKGTIDFSETAFEAGDVKRGEMVTHVFTIKNSSDQPLKITRVRGS